MRAQQIPLNGMSELIPHQDFLCHLGMEMSSAWPLQLCGSIEFNVHSRENCETDILQSHVFFLSTMNIPFSFICYSPVQTQNARVILNVGQVLDTHGKK